MITQPVGSRTRAVFVIVMWAVAVEEQLVHSVACAETDRQTDRRIASSIASSPEQIELRLVAQFSYNLGLILCDPN